MVLWSFLLLVSCFLFELRYFGIFIFPSLSFGILAVWSVGLWYFFFLIVVAFGLVAFYLPHIRGSRSNVRTLPTCDHAASYQILLVYTSRT